jgi:hypothetical protein
LMLRPALGHALRGPAPLPLLHRHTLWHRERDPHHGRAAIANISSLKFPISFHKEFR